MGDYNFVLRGQKTQSYDRIKEICDKLVEIGYEITMDSEGRIYLKYKEEEEK